MKLSEYLAKSGMTSKEYFDMQKRREQGKTTLGDYQRQQRASIVSRLEVLNTERFNVYDTYKSRFFNEDGEYVNSYRNDTEDAYNSFSSFKAKYDTEAKEILEHLDRYGGDYDAEWVNGVKKWLNGDIESFGEMERGYKADYDYWSQWDTEDEYKSFLAEAEKREGMKTVNLEDIAVEIADLEKQLEEEKTKMPPWAKYTGWATVEILERKLKEKQNYYDSAVAVQDYEKYTTEELYKLANEATDNDESLYFRGLADQKIVEDKSEILSNNKMDGEDVSVLEALRDLDRIEDKDERKARKKVISDKMASLGIDFDEYYTRITGDDNITLGGVLNWLGKTGASGLDSWNKAITSTADLVLGKPMQALGWENNPISSIAQYYDESYDNRVFDRNYAASKISDSKWIDYAGQFGEGLIAAVPDALLAFMTAGASKIKDLPAYMAKAPAYAQGSNLARTQKFATASAYASGDKLTKAGLTVQSMMKNPNYWSSFARTYGLDYAEAKEMGASDEVAVFGATISSLINAGIEIGIDGGSGIQGFVQDLAEGNKNRFFAWVESSLEEGGEEILQGFVNNLVSKAMYDDSVELANLEQMIAEGAMGTAVGAVLGGGQVIASSAANKAKQAAAINEAYKKHGQAVVKDGGVDTLQALANEMSGVVDTDTAANLSKLAGKVNGKKGVNVKAVGELSYAVNDARIQQNKADIVKALEEKGVSEKKAAKYADILFEMNEEFFAGKESAFTLGTDEQWKKITGDENAYSVLRNIITDEKSAVNIRNLRYGLSRSGIRVDGDGNVNSEDVENYRTRQLARAADEGLITPVKNEFDVSENGKTQITESGETVKKRTFVDGADGTLRLRVNDSSTVDVGDVSFADEGEAIVYSMIVSMGMDAETANAVISLYKGKDKKAGSRFAYEIDLAFNAGKINRSPNILQTIHGLTTQQADAVYKLGRQYAQRSAQKAQERVDAKKKKTTSAKRGEVIYEGDLADENGNLAVKESELTGMQQASLSGIRLLAEISNIRFHIYRSEKMISKDGGKEFRYVAPNGESVTANGFYITGTNDIYIDLNAGNNGEGMMMYTAAHEIMHFIKDFSPAKFQQIADFLMEEYAKRNVNVKKLLDKQIEIVKRSVENRSDSEKPSEQEIHDMAFEEMVCDAMSGMLIDGSFADSMAKLRQTNKGLWQTIADAVAKLLEKWGVVVNAYNNKQMDSQEARLVAQMDAAFRKLQQMFAEGMVDAGAAYAQMEKTGSEKYSRRNAFNADDVIKYSDRNNGKNLVKSKKSRYNEFATLAMQWANNNSTQPGDAKTIYDGKRKKYVLIEATDDGFVEVTAYTRKEYERYYGRVNRSGVGFSESSVEVQNDKGGHRAYDVRVKEAGVNGKNGRVLETERFPVRSENDKQGNRADYQGELIKTSQRTSGKVMYQERSTALLEKEDTRTDYAPVFYSKLERLVDDMKEQKLGADSVIGYLKGRGIKDEEIKHLGIRELLKGKKSVTKLDLKKVIAENKPRIEEVILTDDPNVSEQCRARHNDYALLGGSNYREILFRVPNSTYSNKTMRGHWQEHAKGILAHTRIQDFIDVYGKRLLFIDELQSDWYNQKNRMGSEENKSDRVKEYESKKKDLEKRREDSKNIDEELQRLQIEYYNILDEEGQLEAFPPENLFGEDCYEYILKRLIRLAAEEGYDSLAWTPASIQMLRWTEDFSGAFHILYDQNMPGFLKRYGKQWGATVGTTIIDTNLEAYQQDDVWDYYDSFENLEDIPLTPVEVWNMELTEPMKNAALYEGQMMFQERGRSSDSSTVYDEQAYRDIIRKSDMPITNIGGFVPKNRADTVVYAKRKAAKLGRFDKDGRVSVHVDDLDEEVLLGTDGLKYGLHSTKDTRKDANYIVTLNAGEILRNAVRIDEIFADDAVDDQYVLLGVAANDKKQLHIVRFIVNRPENELASIEVLATEDRAVFELLGAYDSRSSIPVANLLEYVGIGEAVVEQEQVKIREDDVNAQNADVDKHIQRRDNISRANDEGDFINEYHGALSSAEWRAFYDGLVQNGHLQNTRVGTIATVVIGNKLVIAERQYMKEEVHDYVVCDVFRIENYTGSNFVLHLIKEAIEEGDLNYDSGTSYKVIHQFLERNFSTELLARYDGDGLQFVVDSTKKSKLSNTGKVY